MESSSVESALQGPLCRCCVNCLSWKIKVLKEKISELDEIDACFMYENFTSRLESTVRESEKKIDKVEIEKEALVDKVKSLKEERKEFLKEIEKLKVIIKSLQDCTREQDPK